MTHEEKALLDMLSFSEGTLGVSQNGYDVLVGNRRIIKGWTPDTDIVHLGDIWGAGQASTAAGRYQFLLKTWIGYNNNKNAPLTVENQNKAALKLLNEKIHSIEKTALENDYDLFKHAMNKLASTWDSLPVNFEINDRNGRHPVGKSYSGRGEIKPTDKLFEIYKKALEIYKSK